MVDGTRRKVELYPEVDIYNDKHRNRMLKMK
jgi:hypothetical protein